MTLEPRWLPLDVIIAVNRDEVAETGENFALLRRDLLESAAARPQNLYNFANDATVLDLAVSLLFGIAKNHPFEKGNKRTGFTSFVVFLAANGYEVALPYRREFAERIIAVIEGRISEDAFAASIAPYVRPLP